MAAQLRVVRARIRAVKSIGKITRAQELIASSRIIRAQQRTRAAEPYARELTQAVEALVSRSGSLNHPMVSEPESVSRAAVLILTSDGGFAGGYNANVLRESARLRQRNTDEGVQSVIYVAGRKGIGWHRFRDIPIEREWSGFSVRPSYADAEKVATALLEAFTAPADEGGVDEIYLVSTEFVSMLTQRPAVRRLLPLADRGEGGAAARRPAAVLRIRAVHGHRARLAAAPVHSQPDLLRHAGSSGRRAGGAAARDEGRHGQRERLDRTADPGSEQRPAGRDHLGNQRNRRRG